MGVLGRIVSGVASAITDPRNVTTALGKVGQKYMSSGIESFFRQREQKQKYALELEKWRMENEYNHPKNQIKRLEEAGLNPALAYGGADAGNAGSIGSTDPSPYYGDQMDIVGAILQREQAEANIKLTNNQADLTSEDLELRKRQQVSEELKQDYQRLANAKQELENKQGTAEYESYLRTVEDIERGIKLKNDYLQETIYESKTKQTLNFFQAFHEYQQGLSTVHSRKVMDATIKELESRLKLNNAQADRFLQLARNGKWDELAKQYDAALRLIGIDPDSHDWHLQPAYTFQKQFNEQFLNYVYRPENVPDGNSWMHTYSTPQAYRDNDAPSEIGGSTYIPTHTGMYRIK